jgi:hypothetical protein
VNGSRRDLAFRLRCTRSETACCSRLKTCISAYYEPWASHGGEALFFLNLSTYFELLGKLFAPDTFASGEKLWVFIVQSVSHCCREERSLERKHSTPVWYESGFTVPSVAINASYVVGTVNRLRAAQPMGHSLIPGKDKNISILHNVQLALSPQAKQPGYKADHSSPTLTSEV